MISNTHLVAEVIALELRRPTASRQYLHPQIFTGVSYLLGTIFMLELRRTSRGVKNDTKEENETAEADVVKERNIV